MPHSFASGHRALVSVLLRVALPWYAVCSAGRIGLWLWQHERLADLDTSVKLAAFVHGLRMDTIAIGYLAVPVVVVACFAPAKFARHSSWALRFWALAVLLALLFVEVATFPFFAEYDVRPNFLFTAYAEYPAELAALIWADQKGGLAICTLLLAAALALHLKYDPLRELPTTLALPLLRRALFAVPLAALLVLGIRSSLGHRPANNSDALYCPNRVATEIAKNSLYTVAYEAYRGAKDGEHLARAYGEMKLDEAYARVNKLLGTTHDAARPFRRTVTALQPSKRPKNLVILVEESLGARFVGHLGDKRGLTPHIDELAKSSLTFTQLHSNGTRSIRGLSALSSGFLAIPGEGVLKRPKSQSGFFTLASLLEPHGYHTSFVYGGEARFDNMCGWYTGNGFDKVIEDEDYDAPSFRGTWGVCDEDLLMRANELHRSLHAQGKPFVSVIFTSSNHAPFDLPEGKIEWVAGAPRASVENAIRYADWAVGRYFDVVRAEPFFDDTVFVLAADHDVRVYGDDVMPVDGFHIPGLIHGAGVEPRRHDGVASQPDLLATALAHLGLDLEHPILGTPLTQIGRQEFALMQFNESYGFRRKDAVAVLRPGLAAETFRFVDHRLQRAEEDLELERDGLALIVVAEDLYERQLYR
jgi:phosphoglycerol transferase MdoB-like AlkP superfamily enzyme